MKEHVNHPAHYNQHPSGVECIVIIRHYTCDVSNAMKYLWRAGLKSEEGMPIGEKEVEDLRKAVWYLTDYLTNVLMKGRFVLLRSSTVIQHPANISIETIAQAYQPEIAQAMDAGYKQMLANFADLPEISIDYAVAGRLSLWNIISLELSHEHMDEVYKNALALSLNIRLVEVDAGVSFQSPNFTKSFSGAGLGAFATVAIGF